MELTAALAHLAADHLEANAEAIAALARLSLGLSGEAASREQALWKPAPEEWALVEVVCHLYDEEREDFRTRLRLTLTDPQAEWPPIDPRSWVTERAYLARDPGEALQAFLDERRQSLAWLRSLENPQWDAVHTHPQFGSMSAGQILTAWVAHDHLHLRQLNQLHWQYLASREDPFGLEYAGGW